MKKKIFVLISFIINVILIICADEKGCLNTNKDSKIYLSSCLANNDESKNKDISNNKIYCCLLTLTYENKTSKTFCMTTLGDKDVIEDRIDMFKYQKDVNEVSIDCSSNYLIINILFFLLLMI